MFTEPLTSVSISLVARLARAVGKMGGSMLMSGIAGGTAAEPVTYDKDGIVYPNHTKVSDVGRPVVSNAKRVSTQTAAEARATAKARKASAPSPRRDYSNDR